MMTAAKVGPALSSPLEVARPCRPSSTSVGQERGGWSFDKKTKQNKTFYVFKLLLQGLN
jgi:hypothetical protein